MFNLFKKNKFSVHSVQLPDWGWKKDKEDKSSIVWINKEQTMALSINFFNTKPVIPSITDIERVREFYRYSISQVEGGIIEISFVRIKGLQCIRTIFKIPQEPSGITYIASLTIPLNKSSFVIKLEAPEIGETGLRESIIGDRLLQENKITVTDNGFENWTCDPYKPDYKEGLLMNQSEKNEYDKDFPEHPLTVIRKLLDSMQSDIRFKDEILKNEG